MAMFKSCSDSNGRMNSPRSARTIRPRSAQPCLFRDSSTSVPSPTAQFFTHNDNMTTHSNADGLGQNLFGFGVLWFSLSSFWLVESKYWPQGLSRAEVVLSAVLAAFGILLWRSAFCKLSLANVLIVLSCASAVVIWAFKMYDWFHFSNRQSSLMTTFGVAASGGAITVCAAMCGAWWAGAAHEGVPFTQWLKFRRKQASERRRERATLRRF